MQRTCANPQEIREIRVINIYTHTEGHMTSSKDKHASCMHHSLNAYPRKHCQRRTFIMASVAITIVVLLLVLVPTLAILLNDGNSEQIPLKVGAFNVQAFGKSKLSKVDVVTHLTEIVSRYDIVVIQEVRDISGEAQRTFWRLLNATSPWGLVQSERLGRSSYKEQYAFFYKTESVRILGSYLYPDSVNDTYEREPFSVELEYYSVDHASYRRVVLLALHTTPKDALTELEHLPAVILSVAKHFRKADGVIALGDFNADCSYVSVTKQRSLELFMEGSRFNSLIPASTDSTVASTDCAYDRVVVYGNDIRAKNAKVFAYEADLNISTEMAAKISDHYPIEFDLY